MRAAIKKYWILISIEILLLLLVLPGCFQKESMVYADREIVLNVAEGTGLYKGQNFQVNPGVYQVRVSGVELPEGIMYVTASCEQSSFRTFRCNGAAVFEQQDALDFEIYVLESIDSAYLNLELPQGQALIERMEVYKVNLGSRILTFFVVVGSLGLNLLLAFRDGVLSGRIAKEKQVVFWGLAGSILLAYFPYMTDYFSAVADIAFHWLRIEGLKETLMQGNQFPVRVQSYWLYDHGYAVSAFYGDLFLLIPVLFRWIGFSLMDAYKMFVLVVTAATALISYYSFKQCTKHTYAALFGSIIYMLAPYRIYNFYNRGAVGEYLAMTFFPLVICGMYRLFTEDVERKRYQSAKWPLIIGLSCILQSHILSSEMTVIFILVICLVFFRKTFRKRTFLQLVQAAALCLLLNVWFWLPLLQMMTGDSYLLGTIISKSIQYMGTWFAEVFQLYPNMGGTQNGMYNAEPFQIGIASLVMLVIVLIVLFGRKLGRRDTQYKNPYDRIMLFWSAMILISWFLSTRYFPWDFLAGIPVIKMLVTALQFPTRLFAVVSVFAAMAASFFFLWFDAECKKKITDQNAAAALKKGGLAILLILAVGSAVYHVNDIAYSRPPIWLYNSENMGSISVGNGEYLLEGTWVYDYQHHMPEADEGLEWSEYKKEGTSIRMNVKNTAGVEKFIELPLIGYKGYAVECDDTEDVLPYITEERGQHGDLRIAVPAAYEGYIEVSYKGLLSFRIAEMISLLTAFALIADQMRRRIPWKAKTKQCSER